jgi:hypothetical protein
MFSEELFRDCSVRLQIAGSQPTFSAALATCGVRRIVKRLPSRPLWIFLDSPYTLPLAD